MTGDSHDSPSMAALALSRALGAETVDAEIDGRKLSLALWVDQTEHQRRREINAGAVTSTGMLHGLWMLPSGGTVPAAEIPSSKRARFRSGRSWVTEGLRGFERLYSPAGIVTAAAVHRTRQRDALRVASALPPIFERYAIVISPDRDTLTTAHNSGVGLIVPGPDPKVIVEPELPVTGRPAVYRWWVAEIAYAAWLQTNAQPVS